MARHAESALFMPERAKSAGTPKRCAMKAVVSLNGMTVWGNALKVEEAKPRLEFHEEPGNNHADDAGGCHSELRSLTADSPRLGGFEPV